MYKYRGIIALIAIIILVVSFFIINSISTSLAIWLTYAIVSLFLVGFSIYLFIEDDYDKFKIAFYSVLLIIAGFYIAKLAIWIASLFH